MQPLSLGSPRVAWAFTLLGAAVAAWITRDLPPSFLLSGAPLARLCVGLAVVAGVGLVAPSGAARVQTALYVMLAGLRLAIPLVLTLAWTGDGRELWSAVAVFVAVHDARHERVSAAPLAPVAMAMAIVIGWSAMTRQVAPARAVLVALIAGVAAAWSHDQARRTESG